MLFEHSTSMKKVARRETLAQDDIDTTKNRYIPIERIIQNMVLRSWTENTSLASGNSQW